MYFDLQAESSTPIYRQIVDQLRRQINAGLLRPGDALPSVRQVAERHTVNPMTVSRAYSLLEAEGLLLRQRGKPMTVAAGLALESSVRQRLDLLKPSLEQVIREARQLGLGAEAVIEQLTLLMDKEKA
jgi:GntR family transcriptional regulator